MRKNHYILMTCIENVTLFGYLAWNSKFEISFTFCFPMILKYLVLWILKSHYKLHLIFLPSPTSYQRIAGEVNGVSDKLVKSFLCLGLHRHQLTVWFCITVPTPSYNYLPNIWTFYLLLVADIIVCFGV